MKRSIILFLIFILALTTAFAGNVEIANINDTTDYPNTRISEFNKSELGSLVLASLEQNPINTDNFLNHDVTTTEKDTRRPQGSTCSNPLPLTFPAVNVSGHTENFGNDYKYNYLNPPNWHINANDVVYQFTFPTHGKLNGTITSTTPGSGMGAYILLSEPKEYHAPEVTIQKTTNYSQLDYNTEWLDPGTYFLIISCHSNFHNSIDYTINLNADFPAPTFSQHPFPNNNATNQQGNLTLTWINGFYTEYIDLYFGKAGEEMALLLDNVAPVESYEVFHLNERTPTTYNWKVVCRNVTGYSENTWSFTVKALNSIPEADIIFDSDNHDFENLPMNPQAKYSISQSIYFQSEFNLRDLAITSISYFHSGEMSYSKDIEIFMKHTTKDSFTNDTEWEYDGFNHVYSGKLNFNSGDPISTITLDTPFSYNDTDNLMVQFFATGQQTSPYYNNKLYSFPVGGNRSLVRDSNQENFFANFPGNQSPGYLKNYLPVTGFNYILSTDEPQFISSANILSFEEQLVHVVSDPQTLTISNFGIEQLDINSLILTGANSDQFLLVDENSYPVSLGLFEHMLVSVKYIPTTGFEHRAELQITDDQSRVVHTIQLVGNSIDNNIYEINIPYAQGFEDPTALIGWNFNVESTNTQASSECYESIYHARSGEYSARFFNPSSATSEAELVSPVVIPEMDGYRVRFWAKKQYDSTEPLIIGKYDSTMETFTLIDAIELTKTYAEYIFDMIVPQRANERFAFQYKFVGGGQDIHIDDIILESLPTAPLAELSVSELDFAPCNTFSTSPIEILMIRNVGIGELNINEIELTGANADEFSYTTDSNASYTLAALDSLAISVTFRPTSAGAKEATLVITDDLGQRVRVDSDFGADNYSRNANTATLTGFANDRMIYSFPFVEGFEENNVHNSKIIDGWNIDSEIDDSYWKINGTINDYDITPRTGNFNVYLSSYNPQSQTNWLIKPVELVVGQAYDVELYARRSNVLYSRADIGIYFTTEMETIKTTDDTNQVSVTDGDYQLISHRFIPATSGTHFLCIKGEIHYCAYLSIDDIVITASPTVPIISISETTIDFNETRIGIPTSKELVITNTGEGTLNIGAIGITGTHANQFSYSTTEDASLALGENQSLAITVNFAPLTTGYKNAKLTFTDNLGNRMRVSSASKETNRNANEVILTGTGIPLSQGSTCSNPFPLTFPTGNISGNVANFFDDYSETWITPNSNKFTGNDVVYQFTLDRNMILDGRINCNANYFSAFIFQSEPNPTNPAPVVTEAWAAWFEDTYLRFDDYYLPAGDYFLIISTNFTDEDENFTMSLTATEIPIPDISDYPSPEDGDIEQATDITLSWYNDNYSETIDLHFGEVGNMELILNDVPKIDEYQVTNLNANTTYEWKVVSRNYSGTSADPETWSFTTIGSIPEAADNYYPENNSINISPDGELCWSDVTGTNGYRVYFGTNEQFSDDDYVEVNGECVPYFEFSDLNYNTTYYWKVVTYNILGDTNEDSDVWSFTTRDIYFPDADIVFEGERYIINNNMPMSSYDGYTVTQNIYEQAEFNIAGKAITSISYLCDNNANWSENIDIFMKHTDKSTFSDEYDWEIGNFTQVYNGTMNVNIGEPIVNIPLDTPFAYNNRDNLVVLFFSTHGGYINRNFEFYTYAVEENRSLTASNSGETPYILNDESVQGSLNSYLPLTGFNFETLTEEPQLHVSAENLSFFQQATGTESQPKNIIISNLGQANLSINNVTLTGTDATQFTLSDENDYPVSLGFNENMVISVVYAPTTEAEHTAELQITDNQGRIFRFNSATEPTINSRGLYSVTLKGFTPILGSVCSNPLPLEFPAVNIKDYSENYFNDYAEDWIIPSSWYFNGCDVVYQFTVATTVLLNGTIEDLDGPIGAFILQDEPNAANPALVISQNTSEYYSLNYDNEMLPAGTYYLIISKAPSLGSSQYTINLTADPLPIPSGATSLFPPDNAINNQTNVILSWVNAEYTETIDLYFGKADANELPLVLNNIAPVDEYQVTDLDPNTLYKWKVVNRNHNGETEETWLFTTTGSAPVAAANPIPANASLDSPFAGNLTWDAIANANGYKVHFGTDASFTGMTPVDKLVPSYDYSHLESETTYYWKVVPYNDIAETEEDEIVVWSFKTMASSFPDADLVFDGTRIENGNLPINRELSHTMTQSIYKQSELNIEDNSITSISYLYNKNSAWSIDISIYMKHTDKSAFSHEEDWEIGNFVKVYNGPLAVNTSQSVVTINLDQQFPYNNTDNLVVLFMNERSETMNSADHFYNYSVVDNRSITATSGYYGMNMNRPSYGTLKACLPVTGFNYIETPPELVEPLFTINTEVLNFGSTYIHKESYEQTFTVSNLGIANLCINEIILTGADAEQFKVRDGNSFPVTLGFQNEMFVSVVHAPTAIGIHTAELQIIDDQGRTVRLSSATKSSNDNRGVHSVTLNGNCPDPAITSFPFTESFTNALGKWTQYSEIGTNSWLYNYLPGYEYCEYGTNPRTTPSNVFLPKNNTQWLFRTVQLVGGQSYGVELYARQDNENSSYANIGIYYGTTDTPADMIDVTGQVGLVDGDYQRVAGSFIPATSGTYFVGIKGVIDYRAIYLSLDDITISKSVPIATLSATELDFGVVSTIDPVSKQLSIRNTGDGVLNINTPEITGLNADEFSCSIAGEASMALAEGQSLEITVIYDPIVAGEHTAQLQVTDNVGRAIRIYSETRPNASNRSTNSVNLVGSFTDPMINELPFTEGFESYSSDSEILTCWSQISEQGTSSWLVNKANIDDKKFPRTGARNIFLKWHNTNWLMRSIELIGGTSYDVELYARQDGTNSDNANIGIYYSSSTTTTDMIPITGQVGLVNGDYQQITGSFTPATSGIYYLGIKGFINATPWYLSLDDFTISKTPVPIVTLSVTELDFGVVTLNTSASEQISVTNTGVGILNIEAIEIEGVDASEFSWSTTDGASTALAADETLNIEVIFTPTSEASKSASLIITDNMGRNVRINSASRATNGSRNTNQVALRGEVFTPLQGSICANPIPLTYPTGNVSGNTAEFFNDYSSAWITPRSNYLNGDDVVYQFTLATGVFLNGTITTTDSSMGAFILKDEPNAANPANVTLGKSSSYSNTLTYTNEMLFPGTYFLIISSNPAPQSLEYVINLTVDPLPPTFPDADIVFDGEKTDNQKIPMNPYDGFSISQSIYKQAELNIEASAITSISYLYNQNSAWSETIEIFMKHTAKDNFENNNDWEIGDFTHVYSGSMAVNTTESIVNLALDNPFIYNGSDNLVVLFYATDSEWASGSDRFYSYPVTGNRTLSSYGDQNNFFESFPNIATPGSLKSYLPVTGFNYQAFTEEPQFTVSAETLTFTDQTMNTESAPQILAISNFGWAALDINSIALTGTDLGMFELTDANNYPVTLGTGENIALSVLYAPTIAGEHTAELQITDDQTRTVHTVQLVGNSIDLDIYEINIPYTVGFETEAELLGWTTNVTSDNGYSFAQREIEFAMPHTGDCCYLMYQMDLNTKIELISPLVVPDMDAYRVKFWAIQQNPNNTDPLVIGKYDATMEIFTEIASFDLAETGNGGYTEYVVNMDGLQRTNERFAFKYESSGEEQVIWIDDITFEAIPTTPVAELSVTEHDFGTLSLFTTSPTKTVTITNVGINLLTINDIELTGLNVGDFAFVVDAEIPLALATSESLDIAVTFVPTTEGAKEATLVITDDLGTRVRLNSASKASNYNRNSNTVALAGEAFDTTISSLPFTEGFEENNVHNSREVIGWSQFSEVGASAWTINETETNYNKVPRTGSFNACLRWSNTDWLIRPIQLVGGQTYDVELYARQDGTNSGNANIGIYYGTTAATDAMVAVAEQVGLVNGDYQLVSGSFIPDTDGIYFLGIKGFIDYSQWYISLDDITIKAISVPTAILYSAPADLSIDRPIRGDLSWQAATGVDGYKVYLGTDEQFSDVTPVQQLGTSYTYSGLDYSETYFWKVIAYNNIGETTENISVWSFTTMADPSLDLPVYVDFNSSTTQPAEIAAGNMSISEIHGKNSNGMYSNLDDSLTMAYVQFHPLKNVTTGTEFSFVYRMMEESSYPSLAQTIGTDDYIQILISENGGASYTTVKEIAAVDHVVSQDFAKVKASLDAYAGKSIIFRVEAHRATNDYYVDFDNFYFGKATTEIVILPGEDNGLVIAENVELQFTNPIEEGFTVDVLMMSDLTSEGTESNPELTDTFLPRYWRIDASIDSHGMYDITFDLEGLGIDNYNIITFYKRANSAKPWEDVVSLGATLFHNGSKVTISGLDKFSEFVPAFDSTLPVTLASFSAIQTTNNLAQISWVTASENNVLGYNIYRAEHDVLNDAIRITPNMIEALNASTGASYSYVDKEVELDMTYYYWLQTNDFDGTSQTNGPVTVTISSDGEDYNIKELLLGTQLFANYPNPFNPSTTISFSVAEPQVVTINVYNLRGQLIKKVFDMKVNEINVKHNVVWNGQDFKGRSVASGIYFTIMEVGGKRFTNKAVLMK